MKIKMICIDLDGTLFNGKKIRRISKEDRETIYNAYKQGIKIIITTGRIFNNAANVSRSLKLRCPVIAANGSVVGDEDLNNLRKKIYRYKNDIVKCVVYSLNSSDIKKFKEELSKDGDLTICGDGKYSAEVTDYDVSKGEAVKFLSEYLKIDKSEVLCIGDNENDISMIKNSGAFVAMGNAVKIARKSADYVTDTNKNCGVAKAIKKFLH